MLLWKVAVVAISLALDVFAVSLGVGMRGAPLGLKVRIGAAFATAEVTMTVIGIGLGRIAGAELGDVAGYLGFAALIAVGTYMMVEARIESDAERLDLSRGSGLLLASLAISVDSLGIGFSIMYIGAPVAVSLAAIAIASVTSTSLGLALGARLGGWLGQYAAFAGGLLLALTGIAFAVLKAHHLG